MLSGPSFRSAFVFSINSLILSGFPLTSFHLAEDSLSAFSWLYIHVFMCVQLSKYTTKCLLLTIIHILSIYSFCNQPASFAQLENVNKLWKNNCAVHVNKRNQNKNKTKSSHIQINHAFYYSI